MIIPDLDLTFQKYPKATPRLQRQAVANLLSNGYFNHSEIFNFPKLKVFNVNKAGQVYSDGTDRRTLRVRRTS